MTTASELPDDALDNVQGGGGNALTAAQSGSKTSTAKTGNPDPMAGLMAMMDQKINTSIQQLKKPDFNSMLDQITDDVKSRGETMSHAKFKP